MLQLTPKRLNGMADRKALNPGEAKALAQADFERVMIIMSMLQLRCIDHYQFHPS
jgi:hypothetical protein